VTAIDSTQAFWLEAFAPRLRGVQPSTIRELLKLLDRPGIISFAGGIPDPALFPQAEIAEAAQRILTENGAAALQYAASEGYPPLRDLIAERLAAQGAPCTRDNILITSGAQQGLDFLARLFLSPGDEVLVERPTYLGALQAFNAQGPVYGPLPGPGSNRATGGAGAGPTRARFGYIVPDFQNPTGECLSLEGRRALVENAAAMGLPLIEDTAYSPLRYEGADLPSLLALDIERAGGIDRGLVIQCGTFSKTIAPALRIGWVAAPRAVIERLVVLKQGSDLHASTLNQMIAYEVARRLGPDHLRRIRDTYRPRRDALLKALDAHFPKDARWTRPLGGMFVWATLPEPIDTEDLLRRALEADVAFVPGRSFHADDSGRNTLRLNFSLNDEATIAEGIRRLGGVIRAAL
jgi:DNA-binding transcriptional MocR family regulator